MDLTKREIQIVSLVARGYSNREIGQQLYIEVNTVKTHVSRILKKLEAKNRANAVYLAIQKVLI